MAAAECWAARLGRERRGGQGQAVAGRRLVPQQQLGGASANTAHPTAHQRRRQSGVESLTREWNCTSWSASSSPLQSAEQSEPDPLGGSHVHGAYPCTAPAVRPTRAEATEQDCVQQPTTEAASRQRPACSPDTHCMFTFQLVASCMGRSDRGAIHCRPCLCVAGLAGGATSSRLSQETSSRWVHTPLHTNIHPAQPPSRAYSSSRPMLGGEGPE